MAIEKFKYDFQLNYFVIINWRTGNFNLLFGWPCIMDGNYFVVIAGRTCMYLNLWLVLYPCVCISAGVKFEQINLGTKPVFKPRIPSRTIEQFWEQVNASRTPTNYEIHFEQNPIHTYIYWIQKTIEERNQLLFRIFTIYICVFFFVPQQIDLILGQQLLFCLLYYYYYGFFSIWFSKRVKRFHIFLNFFAGALCVATTKCHCSKSTSTLQIQNSFMAG